jgi:hypothetical protein
LCPLIYPDVLMTKGTTESDIFASYLDILFNFDSKSRLTTTLHEKRDDFNLAIVHFPFLCSHILISPAYGVYIPQLIWYARACCAYDNFLELKLSQLLTKKLLQGYNDSYLN